MADKKRVFKVVLAVLMIATLTFIFVNSCLPKDVSSAESEAVGGFIASIFPDGTWMNAFLTENVRKIAHFTEFGALGAEAVLYVLLFASDRKRALVSLLPAPFIVGLTDETIQIFSNRGPEIADVWIDIAGFVTAGFIAIGIYMLVGYIRGRIKNKRILKSELTDG